MRRLLPAPILLIFSLLPAFGQDGVDSSLSPSHFSFELRGGITELTGMMTLELQFRPFRYLSVDAGFRPVPWSFYGGISLYPVKHLFLQLQSGYMKLTDTPGPDAPVFTSDFFGAGRAGLILGKESDLQFTASLGEMIVVDHDYCNNCGFVSPPFSPHYQQETKWLTTVELGLKLFL